MIANLEVLFILRCFRLGRLHDEMLLARLKPFAFDPGDFVSFFIPYEGYWTVGIAVAGVAGDLDVVGLLSAIVQSFNPLLSPSHGEI
jgi:hypothetical protein